MSKIHEQSFIDIFKCVYNSIFSKSTHFVRKIDFYSVENCEPLLLSSENIFIAFDHMLAILLGTENPVVRGHLNQ